MPRKSTRQLIRDADDTVRIITGRRLSWWGKFLWNNLGPHSVKDVLHDTEVVDDPYQVLGLHSGAHIRVVKAAYKQLAQEHHPDHGGDPKEFKKIQEAYDKIVKERQEQ